ncbi:conserved domain protein [Paraprevotella xylaniphila YIT 11841]|uniref:Conserved domain protein n=1 Tax=Paraprevotella xylaniphila YIT 11841 TaxID=762982 RepID=F3QPC3_9BACT|nr:conserved domain protein [Paraprevotella xylaniphila YIT 11841]
MTHTQTNETSNDIFLHHTCNFYLKVSHVRQYAKRFNVFFEYTLSFPCVCKQLSMIIKYF